MRLFFGIDVTAEIRTQLADVQSQLKANGVQAGNWSRPELFHLTLLFIGAVADEQVPILSGMGAQTAAEASPFTISFASPGMFEKNRILWFGLKQDKGMNQLREVHRGITSRAKEKPFIKVDERPYSPHLTLARKLNPDSIPVVRAFIAQNDTASSGEFSINPLTVNSICLFESKQVNGQLAYPILERFSFGR